MQKAFVIVGAGFSGTVLAANLLRRPPAAGARIVLIERRSVMGRGVAYAEHDFPYLLNVPAARSSADPDDPQQFLRFAKQRLPQARGEDYLPRALYGDYVQDFLSQAEKAARAEVNLRRVFGEATAIHRAANGNGLSVEVAGQERIDGHVVILALGNPASPLPPWAEALRGHGAFRRDPRDLPNTLSAQHSVLIVGNGLTMADAASALSRHPQRVPNMHTISRRGLFPKTQSAFQVDATRVGGDSLLAKTHSLRQLLRACRELARQVERLGGDWREAVAFIRAQAPALWRRMPHSERRRFVRHLQVHWDIHRHRLPPQLSERVESLRRSGKLKIGAGQIKEVVAKGGRFQVSWRPRGREADENLTVDLVVNATGPNYNIERSEDPLINSLRASGMVSSDALKLGIRTAQFGACVDREGRVSELLYYLGPMLRADHLDATAAAELSVHARDLAGHLADPRVTKPD